MDARGLAADEKELCDLPIGEAVGDQLQDLDLPRGQPELLDLDLPRRPRWRFLDRLIGARVTSTVQPRASDQGSDLGSKGSSPHPLSKLQTLGCSHRRTPRVTLRDEGLSLTMQGIGKLKGLEHRSACFDGGSPRVELLRSPKPRQLRQNEAQVTPVGIGACRRRGGAADQIYGDLVRAGLRMTAPVLLGEKAIGFDPRAHPEKWPDVAISSMSSTTERAR